MKRIATLVATVLLLGACATHPATAPDLNLHDRFMLTAMTDNWDPSYGSLFVWVHPIYVNYEGPAEYRQAVSDHLDHLAEITGLLVKMDARHPNFRVEISDRDTGSTCQFDVSRGSADIHISSELRPAHIRLCILQKMTQAIGLTGDLDGLSGSRQGTVFASWGGADHLTEHDIALLRILYDERLYSGMPRDRVLAILPEIVADVEGEQEAARRRSI